MSHSVVGVILPPSVQDVNQNIQGHVANLLKFYDENMDVPTHPEPCICGDLRVSQYARENNKIDFNDIRESYWKRVGSGDLKDADEKTRDAAWQDMKKDYEAAESILRKEATDKGLGNPDPECEDCHGLGTYPSTSNPNAKWDWYDIGGRWDGYYKPGNVAYVKDVLAKGITHFALLSDEGWAEEGRMGWFGCVSDGKAEDVWEAEQKAILEKYKDRVIVAVDVHI